MTKINHNHPSIQLHQCPYRHLGVGRHQWPIWVSSSNRWGLVCMEEMHRYHTWQAQTILDTTIRDTMTRRIHLR